MTSEIIRLVIVNFESVDIVKASDGVYVLLDNDVTTSSPTSPTAMPTGEASFKSYTMGIEIWTLEYQIHLNTEQMFVDSRVPSR